MSDRELVERAARGDHDAFAELVRAVIPRLDATARLILRDRELARDVVQDTLVRAWRDIPGLRDPDRFDAWLRRLLVNACIDDARRRRRRPIEVELTVLHAPTISDSTRSTDLRDELDRMLATLSPDDRALVVLHYYLDVPVPEAGRILGISLSAAKSRLHRSIGSLRQRFGAEPVDGTPVAEGRPA